MDTPPQEQFEQLRKIMVIKRYEVPPPGYFNNFSDRVIARIESENLVIEHSWWRRFVLAFDAKPIVACAYTFGVGGLLFVGMSVVNVFEQEQSQLEPAANPWGTAYAAPAVPAAVSGVEMARQEVPVPSAAGIASSVNPVMSSEAPSFLFNTPTMRSMNVQYAPASFGSGRN